MTQRYLARSEDMVALVRRLGIDTALARKVCIIIEAGQPIIVETEQYSPVPSEEIICGRYHLVSVDAEVAE